MYKKNDVVTVRIEDMSDSGQGIGKVDGLAVFVSGAVLGDEVNARITKVKKRYMFAHAEEMVTPSPLRTEAECPYAAICGGCDYSELAYEAQTALKQKQVTDRLIRLGGLTNPEVEEIQYLDEPFGYRNKAVFHISTDGNMKRKGGIIENNAPVKIGFYDKGTHRVFDCKECLLQMPPAAAVAEATRVFFEEDHLTAFDAKWDQGLMRDVTIKTAAGTGEVMVVYHINGKAIPNAEKLVGMLDEAVYEAGYSLESVYTDNDKDIVCIAGKNVISEYLGRLQEVPDENGEPEWIPVGRGLELEIGPKSFYQVNPQMTPEMYDKVLEYAALEGGETVLDLYCGTGTIGLWLIGNPTKEDAHAQSHSAGFVLGMESVKQAILDANRNAVLNHIVNARYLSGKAEEILPKLLEGEGDEQLVKAAKSADIVILDPPRAGCKPELLAAVKSIAPKKIVYMSCDAATLSRDIKLLCEDDYEFVKAAPFDNFPWTGHVETCCLLRKRA